MNYSLNKTDIEKEKQKIQQAEKQRAVQAGGLRFVDQAAAERDQPFALRREELQRHGAEGEEKRQHQQRQHAIRQRQRMVQKIQHAVGEPRGRGKKGIEEKLPFRRRPDGHPEQEQQQQVRYDKQCLHG